MKKWLALALITVLVITCFAGCGSTATSADSKIFTYGIDSDIDDYNPMTNQMNNYVSLFVFNVYEPLLHLNSNMEYTMDLATNVEQIDELTYVFTLREGVKFHNGQAFTAADVIHTIEYIKAEANGCWRASQYATVDSMTADGDYKLTMKLSAATPALLDNLAYTPHLLQR